MVVFLGQVGVFFATFAAMEAFAWATHRWVMHGFLWCWHASHHRRRDHVFELNDLFAVVFAIPAIVLLWLGVRGHTWLGPIGCGVTAYGGAYALFHDGLVHGRFPVPLGARSGFWRRRLQAHRLHHAVGSKHGCVSYGFLWVQPARTLKAQLSALRNGV